MQSDILTADEAQALLGEKQDLLARSLEAKTQGEANRLSKQIIDIQAELDADLNERRRTGFDEARNQAARLVAQVNGGSSLVGAPSEAQMREFTRPVDPSKPMQQQLSVPIDLRAIEQRLEFPLAMGDIANMYGNYGVGVTVADAMLAGLVGQSAIIEAGPKIFRTPTAEPLVIPTAADITADYRAESSAATQDTVVMSKLQLSGFHVAGYTEVTSEFEGSALDGGGPAFVSELCGRSLGVKLATELAVGTDAAATICGAFNAPTVGVTAAQHGVHGHRATSASPVRFPGGAAQRPLGLQ